MTRHTCCVASNAGDWPSSVERGCRMDPADAVLPPNVDHANPKVGDSCSDKESNSGILEISVLRYLSIIAPLSFVEKKQL